MVRTTWIAFALIHINAARFTFVLFKASATEIENAVFTISKILARIGSTIIYIIFASVPFKPGSITITSKFVDAINACATVLARIYFTFVDINRTICWTISWMAFTTSFTPKVDARTRVNGTRILFNRANISIIATRS